jgi:hypothetical protein
LDYKIRPAVVLAELPYGVQLDYLICNVTTKRPDDPYLLELSQADLASGKLGQTCYIRPTYTFTVGERLVQKRLCTLKPEKLDEVVLFLTKVINP